MAQKKTSDIVKNDIFGESSVRSAAHNANISTKNLQLATDTAKECMDNFIAKAERSQNMDFGKSKGFVFEEMEGAKLEVKLAEAGEQAPDFHVVTDTPQERGGAGNPHDPSDFRLVRDGETVSQGQAKVYENPTDAARALLDPKYADDQFVVPKDQVGAVKADIQKRYDQGRITEAEYDRAMKNLDTASEGFKDTETGISSGGTSTKEVEQVKGKDGKISQSKAKQYAEKFKLKAGLKEVGTAALTGAVTGAAITGVVTLVKGSVEALMTDGDFEAVLAKTGIESTKAAVRGGATAGLGASIRYIGTQAGSDFFANASYSMAIAGGAIELSGSLIDFINGRTDAKTFAYSACRACTTSVAAGVVGNWLAEVGAMGPGIIGTVIVPFAVMTAVSMVAGAAFDILKNEHLRTVEAQRIEAMYNESARQLREMHAQIEQAFEQYKMERLVQFSQFFYGMTEALHRCDINAYDDMMHSVKKLAGEMDIELKHSDFDEFCEWMTSKK